MQKTKNWFCLLCLTLNNDLSHFFSQKCWHRNDSCLFYDPQGFCYGTMLFVIWLTRSVSDWVLNICDIQTVHCYNCAMVNWAIPIISSWWGYTCISCNGSTFWLLNQRMYGQTLEVVINIKPSLCPWAKCLTPEYFKVAVPIISLCLICFG